MAEIYSYVLRYRCGYLSVAEQVRVGGAINTVAIVALPLIAELPSEAWLQPLLVLQLLLWALGQFTVSHPLSDSQSQRADSQS